MADDFIERQLPHSVEAEQAVLGSMLIDSRCVPQVVERLRPDDFYMRQNREIYEVLFSMSSRFETVDPVTALNAMKQAGVYDEKTTVPYLRQLMEITPTAANVMEYAAIVRDKALLRRVGETAGELEEMVRAESGTAEQVLEAAEQRIYAIRQGRNADGMAHVASVMRDVWESLRERSTRGTDIPGLSTGLVDLDRRIAGLNDSDLLILAGRPGMGKSSLAMNVALEVAKNSGRSVAVFSLEMSQVQLGMRLLSMEAAIDNKKLMTGRLTTDEWGRAARALEALGQARLYLDDNPTLSVADMNAKCRRVKDLGLVVIDYLQLMQSAGGPARYNDNRQQIVSDISRSLKLMAKELNVPVICASQLSRANETRGAAQRRPLLSDLRESGSIEQDADIVLFLYRESYYEDDAENPNVAECIVAKNRHGETGTVMLEWRPEFTTFRNLAYGYQEVDEY